MVCDVGDCYLEINEYYEDRKWVSRYFLYRATGSTETKLTERERAVGMEPRWIPLREAIAVFADHASYADKNEMRRGMYLREYTALKQLP